MSAESSHKITKVKIVVSLVYIHLIICAMESTGYLVKVWFWLLLLPWQHTTSCITLVFQNEGDSGSGSESDDSDDSSKKVYKPPKLAAVHYGNK